MKKIGILNSQLSAVIASMGHGDFIVIGDAGLPVPQGVGCIDLALRSGVPGLLETAEAIASELKVERIIIAEETGKVSPHIEAALLQLFEGVEVAVMSHEALKERSKQAKAMVRTGEFTPYANVILVSGCLF